MSSDTHSDEHLSLDLRIVSAGCPWKPLKRNVRQITCRQPCSYKVVVWCLHDSSLTSFISVLIQEATIVVPEVALRPVDNFGPSSDIECEAETFWGQKLGGSDATTLRHESIVIDGICCFVFEYNTNCFK